MNFLFKLLVVFIICATFGYILEVCYRSIKLKRLINPGFLVGFCLPIYGVGGLALYLLCLTDLSFIQNYPLRVVILIVLATIIMTIIEYVAGTISIVVFKNKLWDYSDRWGNIQGVICPLFSLIWGLCCLGFYFLVFPWIDELAGLVSGNMIGVFFVGIYLGIFLVDLCYSLNVLTKIRTYAIKVKELVNFENFKKSIAEKYKKKNGKESSVFSFKLYTRISNFLENHKVSKNSTVEISTKEGDVVEVDVKKNKN